MDGLTLTRSLRATELCDPTGPDYGPARGDKNMRETGAGSIAARFPRCSLSCHRAGAGVLEIPK